MLQIIKVLEPEFEQLPGEPPLCYKDHKKEITFAKSTPAFPVIESGLPINDEALRSL